MIGSLNGQLALKTPEGILVDVGGVGYEVRVPVSTLSELPAEGEKVFLNIYTHVREDLIVLYGFGSMGEKKVFTTVLGVTGVGPKLALAILSGMKSEEFTEAVEAEDIALLSRIPGLGKKTANRLVLELKGKLPRSSSPTDTISSDSVSALINLGYKRADALKAVELARKGGSQSVEDILKESLQMLTEGR
jgi:Holliday junction DNA helicase RuvA